MMQAAVVDANVAVKWVLAEAGSDRACSLSAIPLQAPGLLHVECANILWKKVRLGELSKDRALKDFVVLLRAPVALTRTSELLDDALRLAIELRHPVCDCLYLALALRHDLPLVTADRRLVAAARKDSKLAGLVILLDDLPLD
ncbi:MAG: type II toxin-antitoxin system VapC family toxin [Acidobacteria bacterium]|jgi:predicted nucleic acid-binding protein|nr:type II toxin-antitoxin system VapC family toxin [Acidobacteriota bacterium]